MDKCFNESYLKIDETAGRRAANSHGGPYPFSVSVKVECSGNKPKAYGRAVFYTDTQRPTPFSVRFSRSNQRIVTVQCFTGLCPLRAVYTPVLWPGAPVAQTL